MENFSHASPIFPVVNVQETAVFFRDQLGFTIEFSWEAPPSYIVLSRGSVGLHLTTWEQADQPTPSLLYVFVHDVDAYYQELLSRNTPVKVPPENQAYGMRDFDVEVPGGHRITFGCSVERIDSSTDES